MERVPIEGRSERTVDGLSDGEALGLSVGISVCVVTGVWDDLEVGVAVVGRTVGDVGFRVIGLLDVGLDAEGLRDGLA